jgi:hypothetical protein
VSCYGLWGFWRHLRKGFGCGLTCGRIGVVLIGYGLRRYVTLFALLGMEGLGFGCIEMVDGDVGTGFMG